MKTLAKAAIATSAFATAALLSFGWSEQGGVSVSASSAQARVGRPLTPVSVAGVARRQGRRAAYGYGGYGVGLAGAAAVGAAAVAANSYYNNPGYYTGTGYYANNPGYYAGTGYYSNTPGYHAGTGYYSNTPGYYTGSRYYSNDSTYSGSVWGARAAYYGSAPATTTTHYYTGGPHYGYSGWNDYAQRNGFVCTPGSMVKGENGFMYRCQ